MTPSFSVRAAPHYERLAKKLLRGDLDFPAVQARAGAILGADPYNASRQHHIRGKTGGGENRGQTGRSLEISAMVGCTLAHTRRRASRTLSNRRFPLS